MFTALYQLQFSESPNIGMRVQFQCVQREHDIKGQREHIFTSAKYVKHNKLVDASVSEIREINETNSFN